jgi:hypothetical protein
MPGARCTRSLACESKKHTSVVTTGSDGFNRHSLRNGFNGLFRALPDERILVVTVVGGLRFRQNPVGPTCLRQLGTSNGCQDHTTLPSAKSAVRLHAVETLTAVWSCPAIALRA